MIDGAVAIGNAILATLKDEEDIVSALALEVPQERDGVKQHILIIKLVADYLDFDVREIKEDTAEDFLWIGNLAANLPQDRLTTSTLEYLVSQTVPNLVRGLSNGTLKATLERIINEAYFDLGKKDKVEAKDMQYERYRYLWNFEKLGYPALSVDKIRDEVKGKQSAKAALPFIVRELNKIIQEKTGLRKRDIALYSLEVDGQILAQHPDYRSYIFKNLISEVFKEAEEGVDHLCGKKTKVTYNTTGLKFKFYITDKMGFSSGLGGGKAFLKNFALGKECYEALLVAESFINKHLHSRLADSDVYLIPAFYPKIMFAPEQLKGFSTYIKSSFNSAVSLEGWAEFQERLEEFREYEAKKSTFLINFLFWQRQQAEFKILRLIEDVPPSRIDKLRVTASLVRDNASKFSGDDDSWYLGLRDMYYLIPVRKVRQENRFVMENKKVFEFYDSLFSGKPVSYAFLINSFIDLTKVYRFDQFDQFNIWRPPNPDIAMVWTILRANLLLLYLRSLGILTGRFSMGEKITLQDKEIEQFLEELGYSEPQASLFLLGYLIGEVASAQYSADSRTKPILNKITYQGMNVNKIMRLANEIFEKLRQYRKLPYNEVIFAEAKRLLDKNIKDWRLSDQENVFYVLSGYSYNTYKTIVRAKGKPGAEVQAA